MTNQNQINNVAKYHCTQAELYAICELGWNLLKPIDVQTKVELTYPEYTALYITQQLVAIQKAENLPDFQMRDLPTETAHILLKQAALPAIANWRLLARYITRSLQTNKELIKPNIEAAGEQYLEAASRENPNWEDTKLLLHDGQKYITDNAAVLAAFMPVAFPANYDSTKAAFDTQYTTFITAKAISPAGTTQKINANNAIYDDLILMTEDIREIVPTVFKDEITFAHLKSIISTPGPAGLKGIIKEETTNLKIAGATCTLVELEKDVTTDADGFYDFGNIASGTYTLTISKTGYETLSKEVVIVKGVTSTKNYFLVKTP